MQQNPAEDSTEVKVISSRPKKGVSIMSSSSVLESLIHLQERAGRPFSFSGDFSSESLL
jgi:hypothetical protein